MDQTSHERDPANRDDFEKIRSALRKSVRELLDLKYAIDQAAIVSTTNTAGEIIYANDKMLEVTKSTRSEILGRSHREFNSGYHSKEFFKNLWDTVLAGRVWHGEVRDKARDGSLFWVDTTIVPFMGDDGKPYQFMSIRKDISARKEAEMALEEERAKRLDAERLSAISETAAGIAHEIRNPLSVILLQSQLLQRDDSKDGSFARSKKLGERIESTAKRIEKIITTLQALSRNAALDPMEETTARGLFAEIAEFSNESLQRKGINLAAETAGLDLKFRCRPAQISQVLLNLVNNARDAIEGMEERWIRLGAHSDGSFIYLSVTDSGHGIPKDLREKVMAAFFTTKCRGKGTGLGLSISRKILQSHNGDLFIDEESANTKVVCKIPILDHVGQ